MGNNKSKVINNFSIFIIDYTKQSLEVISSNEDCPLDVFVDPQELEKKDCRFVKVLIKNDSPFEIYGLNRIISSHVQNLDSNYIENKINTQKKDFFIVYWRTYVQSKPINKKISYEMNVYNGKELKNYLYGLGSIGSIQDNLNKKYIFLPTNIIALKYNKFLIYDMKGDLIYSSSWKQRFEFEKISEYFICYFKEI